MLVLNHRLHTKKQIVKLVVTSHATNIMPKAKSRSIKPQNGPISHEHIVQGPHIALVHTCNKELPSHQNCFTLWTSRSHSLGVNPTKTSHACRYAIIGKYRWMSNHHHHYKFSLPMLPWGTSPQHPNKIHRYVKACHPCTTSKSTSPCHLAPMVSSSLELGLQFNPWVTLLAL